MLKGNNKDKPTPMPIISFAHDDKAREHTTVAVIKQPVVEKTTCIMFYPSICKGITIGSNNVCCFGNRSKCEHKELIQ